MGFVLLLAVAVISGSALVFEDEFSAMANLLFGERVAPVDNSGKVLKIAYLFTPGDLNPFSADSAVQTRLYDVYEPLVGIDENLSLQPVLAVYYGLLNEKQWQIHLRQGIVFHDGSSLDPDDVIYSFKQAKDKRDSVAADLLDSVQKFEKIGDHSIIITTKKPDPLLLNKISKLLIVPDGFSDYANPNGTGAYKVTDASDLNDVVYERNENYWGKPAYFGQLEILSIANKLERVNSLYDQTVDFLVNVPPDAVEEIKERGFQVAMMPSLEVGFVMFNMADPVFGQKSVRMAVAMGLNRESFLDLAYGYAKTVNQFVSNGVFGYNPNLKGYEYDQVAAEKELTKTVSGFKKLDVQIFYPGTLKLFGQYFQEQLALIGMNVELMPVTDQVLQEKLTARELPFYYLGWRNDSGDALPFLKSVLHSRQTGVYGVYNGMNYVNKKVDRLIEDSETSFSFRERLEYMQEAMKIAVEDDVVGVPLFETQSIFAFHSDLDFKPRVDSLIYPSKIRAIRK